MTRKSTRPNSSAVAAPLWPGAFPVSTGTARGHVERDPRQLREFTPDEFTHLWRETDLDRYPFPLRLRSGARFQDDYDNLCRALAARLPRGRDADLSAALRIAADPAISLAVSGIRDQPLRAYGAVDRGLGVALVQRAGSDPDVGGNVILAAGSAAIVPEILVALLGSAGDAAGESVGRASLVAERLLDSPPTGHGVIEVRRHVRTRRAMPAEYLVWVDIASAGRYLCGRGDGPLLEPCPPKVLARRLARLCRAE
ncbi:ESX secretion-associated protein EspG [Nocardia sp. NPDC020380]|uniref:ESX secretion-associated protein EspG n=1 Tax=Nocardia sp. NPDC020380 TaxID=3364309 RepID=UPI0037B0AB62